MTDTLNTTTHFNWQEELEKTIVNSLVTTFGLDFLLMEDKRGGDVDTILKAREWQNETKKDMNNSNKDKINISSDLKNKFNEVGNNKENYKITDSNGNKKDAYHSDKRFLEKAKQNKEKKLSGELHDSYRDKKVNVDEKAHLDHVIASSEIHNDAGRILSGLDGVDLSISESNLKFTDAYINVLKSDKPMTEFVKEIPQLIEKKKNSIAKNEERIKSMPENTPEQRHKKQQLKDKIRKEKEHLESLNECKKEAMLDADKKAREEYNKKISFEYYTSSKFIANTAKAASKAGIQMGTRQALGLILAEVWFELREQIPIIYQKCKNKFNINSFLEEVRAILANIMVRVKERFSDLISSFKDRIIAGFFGNLSTTLLNIFLVSEKMLVKMIKEMWNSIVTTIKLLALNPNKLTISELFKECLKILTAGLAVISGSMINSHLSSLFVFPMGDLLASFLSALSTGIMTIAFMYFIEELWKPCKTKIEAMLDNIKAINAELDRYLLEWAKISFNLNPQEIADFADSLEACNSELERSIVLSQETQRRNIDLPFESGNIDSGRAWLTSLKC